jgi:glutaredoxin
VPVSLLPIGPPAASEIAKEGVSIVTTPKAILYTRSGCHLCDDAKALLERYGLSPMLVDIDADPVLRERYTTCVPVVVIDGKERFRGRVNEVLLRRLLTQQLPAKSE